MAAGIYLSHALTGVDTAQANQLRRFFVEQGIPCPADEQRMGDRAALPPDVIAAMDGAVGIVVLASPDGCASRQVQAEVAHVIGRGHAAWIAVIAWRLTARELEERWPALAALGCHPMPDDANDDERRRAVAQAVKMLRPAGRLAHETIVDFHDLRIEGEQACARVWIGARSGELRAPIGKIEAEALRWYLEDYYIWPAHEFAERARGIEANLRTWGEALWSALLDALGEELPGWLAASEGGRRMLTLRMASPRPAFGVPAGEAASKAAAERAMPDKAAVEQPYSLAGKKWLPYAATM